MPRHDSRRAGNPCPKHVTLHPSSSSGSQHSTTHPVKAADPGTACLLAQRPSFHPPTPATRPPLHPRPHASNEASRPGRACSPPRAPSSPSASPTSTRSPSPRTSTNSMVAPTSPPSFTPCSISPSASLAAITSHQLQLPPDPSPGPSSRPDTQPSSPPSCPPPTPPSRAVPRRKHEADHKLPTATIRPDPTPSPQHTSSSHRPAPDSASSARPPFRSTCSSHTRMPHGAVDAAAAPRSPEHGVTHAPARRTEHTADARPRAAPARSRSDPHGPCAAAPPKASSTTPKKITPSGPHARPEAASHTAPTHAAAAAPRITAMLAELESCMAQLKSSAQHRGTLPLHSQDHAGARPPTRTAHPNELRPRASCSGEPIAEPFRHNTPASVATAPSQLRTDAGPGEGRQPLSEGSPAAPARLEVEHSAVPSTPAPELEAAVATPDEGNRSCETAAARAQQAAAHVHACVVLKEGGVQAQGVCVVELSEVSAGCWAPHDGGAGRSSISRVSSWLRSDSLGSAGSDDSAGSDVGAGSVGDDGGSRPPRPPPQDTFHLELLNPAFQQLGVEEEDDDGGDDGLCDAFCTCKVKGRYGQAQGQCRMCPMPMPLNPLFYLRVLGGPEHEATPPMVSCVSRPDGAEREAVPLQPHARDGDAAALDRPQAEQQQGEDAAACAEPHPPPPPPPAEQQRQQQQPLPEPEPSFVTPAWWTVTALLPHNPWTAGPITRCITPFWESPSCKLPGLTHARFVPPHGAGGEVLRQQMPRWRGDRQACGSACCWEERPAPTFSGRSKRGAEVQAAPAGCCGELEVAAETEEQAQGSGEGQGQASRQASWAQGGFWAAAEALLATTGAAVVATHPVGARRDPQPNWM